MKIGILTFPNSPSFGASLQMYALFKALRNIGVDVEVINYINQFMKNQKHINNKKSGRIKQWVGTILNYHGINEFKKFEKEINLFPQEAIHNVEQLRMLSDRYDYMICGSDQVWNPFITDNDMSYLFEFCEEDNKKIAYAPSFGLNSLPDQYKDRYMAALNHFYRLSVREEAGQEIIYDLIGVKAPLVLDPSMLLKKSEWEKCIKRVKGLPTKYIAKFIFNYDDQVECFIKDLSYEKGLPIVLVGGNILSNIKGIKSTGSIGPMEWLYTIMHADYVVTDSFHGAAFSLIFERELFVSIASSTNSRLVTLTKVFDLENRIIQNNKKDNMSKNIDYSIVNTIMNKERKKSLNYIKESIGIL